MKNFTHFLLSCCFMMVANFTLAQCGSIVNIPIDYYEPIDQVHIKAPVFCDPAGWDCDGVTQYFIVDPGNVVTINGATGAQIIGTSTTPILSPADFGVAGGSCIEVVEACYDLQAMQDLVCIMDSNESCCTTINAVFPGVCDGTLAEFDCDNLPQNLGDVVSVIESFNGGAPISIDFFAYIASQLQANAVLLEAVCTGAIPINYCTDTIPNSAPNVLVVLFPESIELLSFEGANTRMGNELNWTTLSETENDYFMIERSLDGVTFEEIGIVEGAGNSSIEFTYKFTDDKVRGALNYYRITDVDYSERKNHSKTIAIETNNIAGLDAVDIVPNPVTSTMTLSFDSDIVGIAQIYVVDGTGKRVMDFTMDTTVGYNQIDQEMSALTNGIYMSIIQVGDHMATEKFLKL